MLLFQSPSVRVESTSTDDFEVILSIGVAIAFVAVCIAAAALHQPPEPEVQYVCVPIFITENVDPVIDMAA